MGTKLGISKKCHQCKWHLHSPSTGSRKKTRGQQEEVKRKRTKRAKRKDMLRPVSCEGKNRAAATCNMIMYRHKKKYWVFFMCAHGWKCVSVHYLSCMPKCMHVSVSGCFCKLLQNTRKKLFCSLFGFLGWLCVFGTCVLILKMCVCVCVSVCLHHQSGSQLSDTQRESLSVWVSLSLAASSFLLSQSPTEQKKKKNHLDLSPWLSKAIDNYEIKWVIALRANWGMVIAHWGSYEFRSSWIIPPNLHLHLHPPSTWLGLTQRQRHIIVVSEFLQDQTKPRVYLDPAWPVFEKNTCSPSTKCAETNK